MKKNTLIFLLFLIKILSIQESYASSDFYVINDSIVTDADRTAWSNQFAIQFNRPVVTYATQYKVELPIEVSPNPNCQWQWVNDGLLICFLPNGERFNLATKYTVKIKKEFKTYNGVEFGEDKIFSFTTLKPDVNKVIIVSWKDSGKPVFQMTFNQFINIKSIEDSIFIAQDGNTGKRTKIKLLDEKKYLNEGQLKQNQESFKKFFLSNNANEKEAKDIVFFEPEENLDLNSQYKVFADYGVVSAHGKEPIIGLKETFTFKTFDKPKLLEISCLNFKNGQYYDVKIGVEDKFDSEKKCSPNMSITLNFSSPIFVKDVLKSLKFTPELSKDSINNVYEKLVVNEGDKENGYKFYDSEQGFYPISIYGNFQPNQTYKIQSSESLKDELINKIDNLFKFSKKDEQSYDIFGKEFKQKIKFEFPFDHYEPVLLFPKDQAINVLEKSTDVDLFISSRNYKNVLVKYNLITADSKSKNQTFTKDVVGNDDIFIKTSLDIRKLLNGKSGLVFGELVAEPRSNNYSQYKSNFLTQVTNLGIIGKIGHYNSLIFVTDLTTGEGVQNAEVSIIKSKFLNFNGEESEVLAKGVTNSDGVLVLSGTEQFDKNLDALHNYYDSEGIMIQVQKNDEMAWLPIRYNHEMSIWQIPEMSYHSSKKYGHLSAWGFTAQGIYKPDQEVDYKFYIRNNNNEKIVAISDLTYNFSIKNQTGEVVLEKYGLSLSEFGTFYGKYRLPKNAKSGWYELILTPNVKDAGVKKEEYEWGTNLVIGRFLVSDFKTSSFKIRTELNKKDVFYKDDIEIINYAELYSGGAFSNASTNVNVDIEPAFFTPKLKLANGFNFTDIEKYKDLFLANISSQNGKTNSSGEFLNKIKVENDKIPYGKIIVDSSINDDSGKSIASRASANYFGVDRFIGLKTNDFFYQTNKQSPIQFLITNTDGELVENIDAHIDIQYGENHIVQLKTGGSDYAPKVSTEWKTIDSCDAKSKLEIEECLFEFTKSGDYRAIATIKDSKNLESSASIQFIVFDENANNITWGQKNNENFDIVPEKTQYKVGEKARFIIKNPLIGGNALITTERYGVIKKFVKKFDKSIEILEFDLDEADAPGFYLSVVITAPRVKEEQKDKKQDIENISDIKIDQDNKKDNLEGSEGKFGNNQDVKLKEENELCKPMAKIGYSRIFVENPDKKININIETNKEVYKPKEKVIAKFSFGEKNKADASEVAIIVVDEAVLDLINGKINYFNPRDSFSQLQSLDLVNYSLFKTILTSARAMLKGADTGGDGGADFAIRSNFINLAYWNPQIILKRGESAEIEFDAPDNLTSWRIIAVSNDKNDLFGLNDKAFKVNKETEIRPLLPDHVLTGDRFDGGFTIFNRSDQARTIHYEIEASGLISKNMANKYKDIVVVEPFTRKTIKFPASAEQINEKNIPLFRDSDTHDNKISFVIKAYDEIDSDAGQYFVKVLPAIRFEHHFNNKIIENGKLNTPLSISNDVIGDMSSLKIGLNNTILSNLLNVFSFMKDYQYSCFEQKLSKMFVGANYLNLKNNVLKKNYKNVFGDFDWENIESEIKNLYEQIPSYQAENGGLAYFLASNEHTSPYLSAMTLSTLLKFEKIFPIESVTDLSASKNKLVAYLDNLLRNNFQNQQYTSTIESDVRAVILEAMAMTSGKSEDILRFKDDFEKMSLLGKAKILNGAILSKVDESLIKKWWAEIMENAVFDGGQYLYFQKDRIDFYSPLIHASKYTENCAILTTALNLQKSDYDINEISGLNKENFQKVLGKVANTIINRHDGKQNFNTHEAILCTDAIVQYGLANEDFSLSGKKAEIKISDQSSTLVKKEFTIPDGVTIKDLSQIAGKNSEIDISVENHEERNKNLYYSSHLSLAKVLNFNESVNHGIEVKRRYQIEKDGKYVDLKNFDQLNNGSVLKVVLSVIAPNDRYFVVADDYIPGCFEPIDQNQNTSLRMRDESQNHSNFYYKDLRQNYARFYSDFLSKGTYEASYFVQVINNGTFDILPAVAKEMYNEESFGTTNSVKVAIRDSG